MTSPNTGLRRTALVVLAVGAALGASACSAGQTSQTANQAAAVDGGAGQAGDVHINNLEVILPEPGEGGSEGGGEAKVGFAVSYTGSGFGDPITLDRLEIDGTQVQIEGSEPLERGCTLVASLAETPPQTESETLCLKQTTATLPGADELKIGVSAPATATFSNGDEIELHASVGAPHPAGGEFTRTPDAPAEGH